MKYLALLRGINVGGKNKIKMAELKAHLEDLGFEEVSTYIQSGNVMFESDKSASQAAKLIEDSLPKKFRLDSELIKALVLSEKQFQNMVAKAPDGFGLEPAKYHYDFIFLYGLDANDAIKHFNPHPEVDSIWAGPGVIYFRRLSARRTASRLGQIVMKPAYYKNMTIRSWSTTAKLLALMESN
jgi:uncharacterized protein (DUF1697 family)